MPEIIITSQVELDALPERFDQYTVVKIETTTKLIISKRYENSSVEAWGQVCVRVAQVYRRLHPEIPVVPSLDATVCKIVNSGQGTLDMGGWHTCETTHCRAGKYGAQIAGEKIYLASTGRTPNFFANNEEALADICKWGAIEEQTVNV